jgi:hypothetical protein
MYKIRAATGAGIRKVDPSNIGVVDAVPVGAKPVFIW